MKFKNLPILLLVVVNTLTAQSDIIFKSSFEYLRQKLNDTGITWVGEYPSGNNTSCTSTTLALPQDCSIGRDYTHNDNSDGKAGFSFTKLDFYGTALINQNISYGVLPWSCVRDNVTGLVWEVKTNTTGIHNKDNGYQWGGLTAIGRDHPDRQGTYFDPSWNELVQGSNDESLCGFNNWRVPTNAELSTIVNKGALFPAIIPAIDTNYFPNTKPSWYWSSSPLAFHGDFAWIVSFDNNYNIDVFRHYTYRVRLVSSGQ